MNNSLHKNDSQYNLFFHLCYRCNYSPECPNGEDELECPQKECPANHYMCKNDNCIPNVIFAHVLIGRTLFLGHFKSSSPFGQSRLSLHLHKNDINFNIFSHLFYRCNYSPDCPNGEDELDCPQKECPANHYMCKNDNCIPNVWVCDGDNDCGDNTDELETCPSRTCEDDQFRCPGGRCIPMNWKCDGNSLTCS